MKKVVILTGAGGGIGRAAAKLFSANNYICVIVDIDEERAKKTLELLSNTHQHIYIIADVSKPYEINLTQVSH